MLPQKSENKCCCDQMRSENGAKFQIILRPASLEFGSH